MSNGGKTDFQVHNRHFFIRAAVAFLLKLPQKYPAKSFFEFFLCFGLQILKKVVH